MDTNAEARAFAWLTEIGKVPPGFFMWPEQPTQDAPAGSRVRQDAREGKANTRSMRYRMASGMSLERALELQRAHVLERGETLVGYLKHFNVQTLTAYARVKGQWEADTEYLNVLVRAALLQHAGCPLGDVNTILRNRGFFEKLRTKGVTR